MDKIYKLTPSQIRTIDEITIDTDTNKKTLNVALKFHANMLNKILKEEQAFWSEIKEYFNLDITKRWRTDHQEGETCIVEVKEKEAKGIS